jgi:hypothetical protein
LTNLISRLNSSALSTAPPRSSGRPEGVQLMCGNDYTVEYGMEMQVQRDIISKRLGL